MRARVIPTVDEIPTELEGDWQPVVIDVLRATSTIAAAFGAGVSEIVPVETPAAALAARAADATVLIAGERNAVRIEGFDFGNSPLEFTAARAADRRVVMTTTNGTRALIRAARFGPVLCASFVNLSAVLGALDAARDVLIVCAGTDGHFSADDFAVAGALVAGLDADTPDDHAMVAKAWYEWGRADLFALLTSTVHGQGLLAKGLRDDVAFCATVDAAPCVPRYDGRAIRIQRATARAVRFPAGA